MRSGNSSIKEFSFNQNAIREFKLRTLTFDHRKAFDTVNIDHVDKLRACTNWTLVFSSWMERAHCTTMCLIHLLPHNCVYLLNICDCIVCTARSRTSWAWNGRFHCRKLHRQSCSPFACLCHRWVHLVCLFTPHVQLSARIQQSLKLDNPPNNLRYV